MTDPSVVSHVSGPRHENLQRYLAAFLGDASIVVASADRFERVRRHPDVAGWCITDCATRFEVLPGTPARTGDAAQLVMETSGTTGEPKLVRYTKETARRCAVAIANSIPLTPGRDYVALVNPRLAYGLSIAHSHLLAGVPVRFHPAPLSLDDWTRFRDSLGPNTSIYLVPHQSFLLAQDPQWSLDGPVELIVAGGAFTDSMAHNLRPSLPGATVVNMYGQAELGPRISVGRSSLAAFREGDVGQPLPGVRVRIAGAADHGVIEVASAYRMLSYFDIAGGEETPTPRWWPTGDRGRLAPDGRLEVTGRDAPDVNFLGSRIHLTALRDLVREVTGVLDCRVSAVDHAVYGQQPSILALTRTRDSTAERRIRRALATEIGSAASAVLVDVVDMAGLPESGKL